MPVQLVLGRAGSGKTRHCFEAIEQWVKDHGLKSKVFFLLPHQATFIAERELVARKPGRSLLGVRVVSFETLVREVAGPGLAEAILVNGQGRRLLIAIAIQQHAQELAYFKGADQQPHLAARIDAAITEIEQSGTTIAELAKALVAGHPMAQAKLADLELIHQAYGRLLGTGRLDPHRQQLRLLDAIRTSPLLDGALVVVDGFAGFSKLQRDVLVAIAQRAARTDIALLLDQPSAFVVAASAATDNASATDTSSATESSVRDTRSNVTWNNASLDSGTSSPLTASSRQSRPWIGIHGRVAQRYLPPDVSELEIFYRTAHTCGQLTNDLRAKGVTVQSCSLTPGGHRFQSDALRAIEQHFGTAPAAPPASAGRSVRLIEQPSELDEVKAAARQIRRWQIQGIRLREIGVQCRNLAGYSQWIAPVFAEHRIPCFVDQRRSLGHHPLLRFMRCLLEIASFAWKQRTVLEMLKCGLLPLEPAESDLLENFVLRHGIDGEGWRGQWDYFSSPAAEDESPDDQRERREAALSDEYRKKCFAVIMPICDLASRGEQLVADLVAPLLDLLTAATSPVAQTLARWIADANAEAKQEHEQCQGQLVETLQSMRTLLGDQRLTFAQFAAMMFATMESMEARLTPPTLDQVLVGQIDRSRSPEFKCMILLGMNEGIFPAAFNEDSIFSDNERQDLDRAGIELQPDSSRKVLDEQFMAYVALTRASHELVLTRAVADEDGRSRGRSGIITQVEAILGPLPTEQEGKLEQAATAAQLAGLLAAWKRDPQGEADPRAAAIWLASGGQSPLAQEAFAMAQSSLNYVNRPSVSRDVAASLFGDELHCSVTRLEHFAACPFRHFAGDALHLRKREVAEVSHLDLGNAFHNVLDELGKRIVQDKLNWSKAALEAHLVSLVQEVAGELRGQLLLSTARNQYLLGVIRRMLDKVVNDQQKLEQTGSYRIQATELTFGDGAYDALPPLILQTAKGRIVKLRGRIDRIDRDTAAGRDSYLIFDYKTREKRLLLNEVGFGLSLQLLTYMLVLRENGKNAQGAMYVALMRKLASKQEPPADVNPDAVQSKPRGLFSSDALDGLEPGLTGSSSRYPVYIKVDGDLGKTGDCVPPEKLEAVLASVRKTLETLADGIFDGQIDVSPYQLGTRSPCPYCDYRPVCRMDVTQNSYRILRTVESEGEDA